MRGGKTDGKMAEPLFPRLHVNDTDKGGPKPPPRNKMALYEMLSIPSQRLTDAPASMLPLPSMYGGKLANMDSSNNGRGVEKSNLPIFQTSAASYNSDVRQGSLSTDRVLNGSAGNSIKRTGELDDAESTFPLGFRTSLQLSDVTQMKLPSLSKNEAEFRARSLFHPTVYSDSDKQSRLTKERCSEGHSKTLDEGPLKLYEPGQGHDKNICSLASKETSENVTTVVKARDDVSPVISLKLTTGEEFSEGSSQMPKSSNSQPKSCEFMLLDKVPISDDVAGQADISAMNKPGELRIDPSHSEPLTSVRDALRNEEGSDSNRIPVNVMNRNDDPLFYASAPRSVSCAFISPDNVVEMIGHKHFWKVRRAIINQQRVFSMQVFELHRIIKVQRIIAGSRHILTRERLFLRETINKQSSVKEPTHSLVPENPSLLLKLIDIPPKINVVPDKPIQKQPHTILNDDFTAAFPKPVHKPGKSAFLPSSMDTKSATWNLPSPVGNQWLVPVMSPSEGLIYKPYTEPPCPPPGGYLPTLYGASSMGQTYFAPYGMPPMVPPVSAKTVEPGNKDIRSVYQSSCIVASERNEDITPKNRSPGDALLLFPTAPTGCGLRQPVAPSQDNEQKSQVIKAIPRNPRLASESAARIIELIQEERKHLCN